MADVGPLYLAELLSTEFMTEQRARGDILFSERLCNSAMPSPTSGTKFVSSSAQGDGDRFAGNSARSIGQGEYGTARRR